MTETGSGRPTRVRYIVLAFLCALSFLTYFDRVCIVRAQNEIEKDLHISDQQMGFVLGAFWLAYALFEIPSGWMGDKHGARRTQTRIVLAWSVFTALSGAAVGFTSLLTCRFLFGVGEAGAYPNIARIQSRWLPERTRARAGGLIWLVARWGGAFSGVILGSLLRAMNTNGFRGAVARVPGLRALAGAAPWRLAFLISGLVGLTWCLLFYPWFRDDPAEKRSVNQAELGLIRGGASQRGDGGASIAKPLPALFTSRSLLAMGALYLFGSFGWSFFVSWMPKFLERVHHVTFEKSEWMTAAPLFFGGIACLVGGVCSDALVRATGRRRLGRAVFPVMGYCVAAAAMGGIAVVHTPRQAVVLMCIAAAAHDFGQAANWATILDIGGAFAGTATGLINMIGNLGNFLQPVIGAWIFGRFGWGALFVTYAGMYLAAAAMWVFINPNRTFYGAAVKPV